MCGRISGRKWTRSQIAVGGGSLFPGVICVVKDAARRAFAQSSLVI